MNCSPKMTTDLVQTNSPSAVSQFDNIAQDEMNNGTSCLLGAVRITTSYVPGAACNGGGGCSGSAPCEGGGGPASLTTIAAEMNAATRGIALHANWEANASTTLTGKFAERSKG